MQNQNTINTNAIQTTNPNLFQQTQQKISVRCDGCNDFDTGTKDELEFYGWYVGRNEAFCATCNTIE